jgi:hypothetical protein
MFVLFVMGLTLVMGPVVAAAQENPRRVLAEELLDLMNMKENTEKSFAVVKKMMNSQMEKMKQADRETDTSVKTSSVTKNTMATMMDMMAEEMSWDKMKEEYINLYAGTFTEGELRGIIEFYKTPAGQAFISKGPELMKRSMELSQEKMAKIMPKIREMRSEQKKDRQPLLPPTTEEKK